jgi:hypothetical protein
VERKRKRKRKRKRSRRIGIRRSEIMLRGVSEDDKKRE